MNFSFKNPTLKTGQLIFLWILLILIVVGNLAVLVALSMSTSRKSRMNYFIKHLAIAGGHYHPHRIVNLDFDLLEISILFQILEILNLPANFKIFYNNWQLEMDWNEIVIN